MTRTTLPSRDQVLTVLSELRGQAGATGQPPTVLGLARRLGLANTTFRRNFADIVLEVSQQGGARDAPTPGSRYQQLQQASAELRGSNRQLREHLDLAAAVIQRLTLENQRLRQQLETAAKVTTITPRPRGHHHDDGTASYDGARPSRGSRGTIAPGS